VTPPSSALTGALQFGGTPNGLREAHDRLTLEAAAEIMEQAMKDRSYQATKLGEEVARYLAWMQSAEYADRTYYEYESVLYRFVLDNAHRSLTDYVPPEGVELVEDWVRLHWGHTRAGTKLKVLSTLSAFFKWCYVRGRISADPMPFVQRPKRRRTTRQAHSRHQVTSIVLAQPLLRDQCCVMLLGKLGLRKNELRLLQIKDIDLDQEQIRLNQKGGDVVFHPIVFPDVLQRLAEHFTLDDRKPNEYLLHPLWERTLKDGTRVFQREDRTRAMSMRGVHEWWVRALERAEVPHFPMHEMRHTAGTEFHRAVHDLELTRQFLRHRSIQTTSEVYMHLDREDLTNAMLKAAGRWDEEK
jgi:integrase